MGFYKEMQGYCYLLVTCGWSLARNRGGWCTVSTTVAISPWPMSLVAWQWYCPSLARWAEGMLYLGPVASTVVCVESSWSLHHRYCGTGHPGGEDEQVNVTPMTCKYLLAPRVGEYLFFFLKDWYTFFC